VEEPKVKLPGTLEELKRCYDVTSDAPQGNWREEYKKKDGSSFARRRSALYSTAFLIPPTPTHPTAAEEREAQLESLVKSIALTPDTQHNKDKARTALNAFERNDVKKVLDALSERKLLSKNKGEEKFVPGRAYRMSDTWTYHARSRFGRQFLQQSAALYDSLVQILGGDKEMLVSELTDDGSMFCLIELLASQQVHSPKHHLILQNFALVLNVLCVLTGRFPSIPRWINSRLGTRRARTEVAPPINPASISASSSAKLLISAPMGGHCPQKRYPRERLASHRCGFHPRRIYLTRR
jgi:hypothetical protein